MAGIIFVTPQRDFDDDEFWNARKVLEKNGVVTFVFSKEKTAVTSKKKEVILPNGHLVDIKKEYLDWVDGVIFVGGGTIQDIIDDSVAHEVVNEMLKRGKIVGASSDAIKVLIKAGILTGKKVACQDSLKSEVGLYSEITENSVETDGLIITSKGVESAKEFGEAILAKFKEIKGLV